MKKDKFSKIFLDELAKTANISVACELAHVSRQSVYRWMDLDPKFRKKVNDAIQFGVESINDLAESKLIGLIKKGDFRSIQYWLDNRKKAYMKPRPKDFWSSIFEINKQQLGGTFIIDTNGDISYTNPNSDKKLKLKIKEDDPMFQDMVERYDPVILKFTDFSEPKQSEEPEFTKRNESDNELGEEYELKDDSAETQT